MTHTLRIDYEYLKNLLDGRKKVEIRFNDHDYQIGDILRFYDKDSSFLDLPKYVNFKITHIHSGLGMEKGYIALSVVEVKP